MIDAPSFLANLYGALVATLDPTLVVAMAGLLATIIVVLALLRAWQDWLALKNRELESHASGQNEAEDGPKLSVGAARIELADMKERIKKLEAIASGVEL